MNDNLKLLGQAIGILRAKQDREEQLYRESPPGQKLSTYLSNLEELYRDVQVYHKEQETLKELQSPICQPGRSILLNNDKLLLVIFLSQLTKKDSTLLLTHLNSCFECEEIFSEILLIAHRTYEKY